MWEINAAGQFSAALWALLLGVFLCLFYDVFRLDRAVFRRSVLFVIFQDVLFWLVSAVAVFCLLLLTTNGQARSFIFLLLICGFLLCRFTISKATMLLVKPFRAVCRALKTQCGRARAWGMQKIRNFKEKRKKQKLSKNESRKSKNQAQKQKKPEKNCKKHLQP